MTLNAKVRANKFQLAELVRELLGMHDVHIDIFPDEILGFTANMFAAPADVASTHARLEAILIDLRGKYVLVG